LGNADFNLLMLGWMGLWDYLIRFSAEFVQRGVADLRTCFYVGLGRLYLRCVLRLSFFKYSAERKMCFLRINSFVFTLAGRTTVRNGKGTATDY
jgi:hypothetical protein